MLVEGMKKGYVTQSGLIAHGRGEAFDYLLGEKTIPEAFTAEKAATALMLSSRNPVISVNGNTAALCPKDIVRLARTIDAKIEVNLYYRTVKRERLIEKILLKNGAGKVYGVGRKASKRIPGLHSERAKVDPEGIWSADAVLVPLEDGDRAEALAKSGKKAVSIDLNPLSRTSQTAYISIVDNVVRAIPNMTKIALELRKLNCETLRSIVEEFDNAENLEKIVGRIRTGLSE